MVDRRLRGTGGTEPGFPANSSRQHRIPGRRDGRVGGEELREEPGSVALRYRPERGEAGEPDRRRLCGTQIKTSDTAML
jgi:hypothetical protein